MNQPAKTEYRSLAEFYPYYLGEHANRTCRRLHFIGTSLALVMVIYALVTASWGWIAIAFVQGYAWAWIGHFFFEHNRPATFKYPVLSYLGDWRMWWDTLTGKIPF